MPVAADTDPLASAQADMGSLWHDSLRSSSTINRRKLDMSSCTKLIGRRSDRRLAYWLAKTPQSSPLLCLGDSVSDHSLVDQSSMLTPVIPLSAANAATM